MEGIGVALFLTATAVLMLRDWLVRKHDRERRQ